MVTKFATASVKVETHAAIRNESLRLGMPLHELVSLLHSHWSDLTDDQKWERLRQYRERRAGMAVAS